MKVTAVITVNTPQILLDLISEQNIFGDSDTKFARKLGVSRSYWTFVRTGKRQIGYALFKGIVQAFPGKYDLRIIDHMRNDRDGNGTH
jgi:hypothetical protein